jgi:hypothetical protein
MPTLWQEIQEEAFDRQDGSCGLCGKRLAWPNHVNGTHGAWHAHHVNGDPSDDRLANCVCLCVNPPKRCHWFAHDGDFENGALLKRRDFNFWDG